MFSAHAREVTRRAAEYCERLIDGAADLHARAQLSAQRVLQSLSLLAQVERRSELRRLEADLRACRPTGRLGAPRSTGAERARDFRGRGSAD